MTNLVLIIHNVRSCHNVGSMLRTAEGLGVSAVYFTGYTPYPKHEGDTRLPHLANKVTKQIAKTSLGAENYQTWFAEKKLGNVAKRLKKLDFNIVGLEQTEKSIALDKYITNKNIALIVGNEIKGIDSKTLSQCDSIIQIPMVGMKESFNVSVASGIALYTLSLSKTS